MVNNKNLKILLLLDRNYPGIDSFLERHKEELNWTEDVDSTDINFIITDKAFNTYAILEEKYKCIQNRTKIISLKEIADLVNFFSCNGVGVIHPKWLEHPCLEIYLRRLIFQEGSLALHQFLNSKAIQINQINITSPFSVGHYSDLVVREAFTSGHNIISVRNFLMGVMGYFAYMQKAHIGGYPIEIQYGQDNSFFVVQCTANCQEFVAEYFWESLEESFENPFRSLLKIATQGVDLFDIHYLEKSKKVIFSAIWNTEWVTQREGKFQSIILNQVESFRQKEKDFNKIMEAPLLALAQSQQNLDEALLANNLPGSFSELLLSRSSVLAKTPLKLKRLITFIVEMRAAQHEEDRKDMDELTRGDIGRYLQGYPDKLFVSDLKEYDKDLIVRALNDQQIIDDLNAKILETQDESNSNNEVKTKILESLLEGLENLGYLESQEFSHIDDDMNQIVDSLIKSEADTVIKSTTDDVTEAVIRVKGSTASLKEKITVIKGSRDEIKDEVWKVKRLEVFDEVKAKIEIFKQQNMPLDQIKIELQKIFKEKLEINDEKSSEFVEGLMENATHEIIDENITQKIIKIDQAMGNNLVEIKLRNELKDRDYQLLRMRKVIDTLKLEVTTKKKLNVITNEVNPDVLKFELEKNIRDISKKSIELAKYKESMALVLDAKDKSLKEFEVRVAQLILERSNNKQLDEIHTLKFENKNIKGLLEISQKRIAGLQSKFETQINPKVDRAHELENDRMKEAHHELIEKLQKFKKEKEMAFEKVVKLEGLFQQLKLKIDQGKTENTVVDYKEKSNGETVARMRLEVIESNNRVKTTTGKLKEIEQKFKFVVSQLETFQAAKGEEAKTNVQTSGKDTAAVTLSKLSLLEKQHEKIQNDYKKSVDDLSERKKELMKIKSENMTMKNQMEVMERKLAKFDKKAS